MTQPTKPDKTELREARAFTKRVYGSALAEKASDSFCAAVYLRRLEPRAGGLHMSALEAMPARGRGGQPLPTIVEFDPPKALEPAIGAQPARRPAARRGRGAPGAEREQVGNRSAAIQQLRTANYQVISTVYDEIERLSTTAVGLAPESCGPRGGGHARSSTSARPTIRPSWRH
jgi:hypothetical protein